jgi:hypothetical protein
MQIFGEFWRININLNCEQAYSSTFASIFRSYIPQIAPFGIKNDQRARLVFVPFDAATDIYKIR